MEVKDALQNVNRKPRKVLLALSAGLSLGVSTGISIILSKKVGIEAGRWALLLVLASAVWAVRVWLQTLKCQDELQYRVQTEASAQAAWMTVVLLIIWPGLQRAQVVGELRGELVVIGFTMLFFVFFTALSRRYL
jgi:hypothetical protein